jgi:sulfur relay protein TusB/DsrH
MATLHLVNRPAALGRSLDAAAPGDTVLCYEHGVLACIASMPPDTPAGVRIVALRHDVAAFGLDGRLTASVALADDAEFVALATRHSPIVSWR